MPPTVITEVGVPGPDVLAYNLLTSLLIRATNTEDLHTRLADQIGQTHHVGRTLELPIPAKSWPSPNLFDEPRTHVGLISNFYRRPSLRKRLLVLCLSYT